MRDRLRMIVSGAVLGAILGALGGWYYSRGHAEGGLAPGSDGVAVEPVHRDQAMRLVWSIIGVVRQLVEL